MSEITMRAYEAVFILRQELAAHEVNSTIKVFTDIIEKSGGSIIHKESWGLRSLAYETKQGKRGHYIMMRINSAPSSIKELNTACRNNNDMVVRFMATGINETSTKPSLMMQLADIR